MTVRFTLSLYLGMMLKGTGQLQPHPHFFFFFKVEILIPLEVDAYVMTACSILLATSTQSNRYMDFPFRGHF